MGKSFLDQSLDYAAIMAGHTARFLRADNIFRDMAQARVDNRVERTFLSIPYQDLLIIDDLGLYRLLNHHSDDVSQSKLVRHRVSIFVITSNRAVEEWLALFDDHILGNSALDWLANASYQIVIEGTSYRERSPLIKGLRPQWRWLTPHPRPDYSLHQSR